MSDFSALARPKIAGGFWRVKSEGDFVPLRRTLGAMSLASLTSGVAEGEWQSR